MQTYSIQQWLFKEAEGRFSLDLGESGIQFHYLHDLTVEGRIDLNYSVDAGRGASRQLIAERYGVAPENVIITHGSQEAAYLCYRTYLAPGDHVITFVPGWQQSWSVPEAMGCAVSKLPLELDTQRPAIHLDEVRRNLRPATRLLIVNTPNNPTGRSIDAVTMAALAELCRERDILLLCDEEYLMDPADSIVARSPAAACTNSLSKTYGLPGLRFGWFIGPTALVAKMVNYKRYVTVTNSSLCEHLAVAEIKKHAEYAQRYQAMIAAGKQQLKQWLQHHPKLKLVDFSETPFAWVQVPFKDSAQFCRELLNEHGVLVMPAEVFEASGALRISIARSEAILSEGFAKISLLLRERGL